MSDKNASNRETLIKTATMVRPALATVAYIPALTHIRFDGDTATAYNDVTAISVLSSVDIKACVPGDLLIKALNNFSAESVMLQQTDASLVITSGRSKVKLPVLPVADFPYMEPDLKKAAEVVLDHSIMRGIERCLLSIGNDPTHPAQMGVTLDSDGRYAVLYSTDNFTISRYQTTSPIELPGEAPVILPTFFCNQLVALAKLFPKEPITLYLVPGALLAEFGEVAKLFTKTLVDLEPLDFNRMFAKHCKLDSLKDLLTIIPDAWDAAFNRALMVTSGEVDRLTKVTASDGHLKLHSTSAMGDADDSLPYEPAEEELDEPVYLDPSLVVRASKLCGLLTFHRKTLVLSDADTQFVHLIAYCAK